MFGQDFDVKVWSKDFEFWNLIKICVRTCFFGKQNSTLGSVVPLAMFLNEWRVGANNYNKQKPSGVEFALHEMEVEGKKVAHFLFLISSTRSS